MLRRFDSYDTVRVQRRCGSQNNEIHDEVRNEHAGEDIYAQPAKLLIGCAPSLSKIPSLSAFLLDLLRRLPKEEVRRNSRAQNPHQYRQILARPGEPRQQRRHHRLVPIDSGKECRHDVGK